MTPWFGGKSRVAGLVWERFGDVPNYVEPFFGSGAVLLGRPSEPRIETVNDKDALLANFWRAIQHDPEAVAHWADWPVNENDQHARHVWLVNQLPTLAPRVDGDPDYYDAKIAGWWVWGLCIWIGSGWCSGDGPWQSVEAEGGRQLVHLGDAGKGVHRQLVHLGNAGMGVHRQLVHLGEWFGALSERLRAVRVCSGDWSRVTGPSVTEKHGMTAVFLDPPYSHTERNDELYREEHDVGGEVRAWAIANGDNQLLRIALCGYEGEHDMPASWEAVAWKATGGYGNHGDGRGAANPHRERIWFSPACLKPDRAQQLSLLEDA